MLKTSQKYQLIGIIIAFILIIFGFYLFFKINWIGLVLIVIGCVIILLIVKFDKDKEDKRTIPIISIEDEESGPDEEDYIKNFNFGEENDLQRNV